jgi:hypothetical protein
MPEACKSPDLSVSGMGDATGLPMLHGHFVMQTGLGRPPEGGRESGRESL